MESAIEKDNKPGEQVSAKKSQFGKQIVSLLIAGVFLYFAFKDCNFQKLWQYAQALDPFYIVLVCLTGLLSHFLRAWRWVILLSPLSERKISLFNSFCAVMYGYAVNVVVPRGGEIARLVSISKTESISWAGVLPTMFIDRLLDIAMLVLLLGLTLTVLPLGEMNMPWLMPAGLSMCAATLVGLVLLPFVGKIIRALSGFDLAKKVVPEKIMAKVLELSEQFDLGTKCLTNLFNLPAIAVLSLSIWVAYWLNLYLMIFAFHLQDKVDMAKSLVVFTVGSVGVLVPTPGSVGSYHFLVSQGLQKIAGINADQALAFATVLHIFCFVIITCVPAAICFAIQNAGARKSS